MLEQDLALFVVEVGDEGCELLLGRRGEVENGFGSWSVLGHGEFSFAPALLRGGFEPQYAGGVGGVSGVVAGMALAVVDHDLGKSNGETPSRQATLTPNWLGFERRLWCV